MPPKKIFVVWHDYDCHCIEDFPDRETAGERVTAIKRLEVAKDNGTSLDAVIEGCELEVAAAEVVVAYKIGQAKS